jgi:hypothetical protein
MNFQSKGISTLVGIIIIAVVAVILGSGILVWQQGWLAKLLPQKPVACTLEAKICPDGSSVGRTGPNCEFATCPVAKLNETKNNEIVIPKDVYFFTTPDDDNSLVKIYKNQQLMKEVSIKTMIVPTLFTLSPDQKYVAFKTAGYGGTCVYFASPAVINLNNFSVVNLDNSDINKKLKNILGVDPSDSKNGFSAVQEVEDIKWTSNTTIEATMKFGDKTGCAILVYPKPANFPLEIEAKIDFNIIK